MGNALRKFSIFENEPSVFKFTIDTTKIVPGATNGSENPLTFRLPILTGANTAILKVSDGRPDKSITAASTNSDFLLTFASAGIYQITIIGKIIFFQPSNSSIGYDRLKFISIDNWGSEIAYQSACFANCNNLYFNASNTLKLPANSNSFFANTLGFPSGDLSNIDVSSVTSAIQILNNCPTEFTDLFNPYFLNITSVGGLYNGVNLTNVSKIEIISDSVTNVGNLTGSIDHTAEYILKTPNNTNLQALCYYLTVMPSLANVDVRNVTNTLNFLGTSMATSRVNETLIAWSNLPFMQSGVTWNFRGSKYSNNPTVLAALNKLTSDWGVIFTNLTME